MDAFGELQSLSLAFTHVSGSLADDWGSTFAGLTTLNLSATALTGSLPFGEYRAVISLFLACHPQSAAAGIEAESFVHHSACHENETC